MFTDDLKIGIMQPYFMPYIGYFQRIKAVDIHVIYDDVNYIKNGWMNHNRILNQGKVEYITLPLRGASPNKLIKDVTVDNNLKVQSKILKHLEYSYKKSCCFDSAMELLEPIIRSKDDNLATYLEYEIRSICRYIGIKTEIIISSDLNKDNSLKGEKKVKEICHVVKDNYIDNCSITYINASTGEHLYDRKDFQDSGINLLFIKNKGEVIYPQRVVKEFVPNLSIVDVLMNCPPSKINELLDDFVIY